MVEPCLRNRYQSERKRERGNKAPHLFKVRAKLEKRKKGTDCDKAENCERLLRLKSVV